MTTKTYTTRSGATQYKPSLKWAERVILNENNEGFCLACGDTQTGCEPDARKYICESCGLPKVYGAEELVMMGLTF